MTREAVATFVLACLPVIVIPGGGFALLLRWSLRAGMTGAAQVAVGAWVGQAIQMLLATGMLVLVLRERQVWGPWTDLLGGVLLAWLGVRSLARGSAAPVDGDAAAADTTWLASLQALGFAVINPKGAAVYGALVPRFVPAHQPAAVLELGLVYLCLVAAWLAVLVVTVGAAAHRARPGARRGLEPVIGAVLVLYGVLWATPAAGRLLGLT